LEAPGSVDFTWQPGATPRNVRGLAAADPLPLIGERLAELKAGACALGLDEIGCALGKVAEALATDARDGAAAR
jgi:hypothetical protein